MKIKIKLDLPKNISLNIFLEFFHWLKLVLNSEIIANNTLIRNWLWEGRKLPFVILDMSHSSRYLE